MKTLSALLLAFSLLAPMKVFAEEPEEPAFDFEKVKPFTFKPPSQEAKPDPNELKPIAPAEAEPIRIGAVHTVLDYPRIDTGISYRPGFGGIKQSLAGSGGTFNLSSPSLLATEVRAGMEMTSRVRIEVAMSYYRVTASASRLSPFTVQASDAGVFSGSLTGYYCFPIGYQGFKICPGGGLGVDSFPILGFVSNTDLSLTTLNDMILRPAVALEKPLSTIVKAKLTLGADFGLGTGSKDGYSFRSDRMLWSSLIFDTFVKERMSVTAGLAADSRSTDFNWQSDSWSASALNFSAILGIRYILTD
jgi:hypothetical protein